MKAPTEAQQKAYQVAVAWYIEKPYSERSLSYDSLLSLAELLQRVYDAGATQQKLVLAEDILKLQKYKLGSIHHIRTTANWLRSPSFQVKYPFVETPSSEEKANDIYDPIR